MNKWMAGITLGSLMYLTSFALPVTPESTGLAEGVLPGWEALLAALQGWAGPLGIWSATTNALMLVAMVAVAARAPRSATALAVPLLIATGINLTWLVRVESLAELSVGYHVWWMSFLVMGTTLIARRSRPRLAMVTSD